MHRFALPAWLRSAPTPWTSTWTTSAGWTVREKEAPASMTPGSNVMVLALITQ